MSEELEQLRAENAYLRSELKALRDRNRLDELRRSLGCSMTEARIILAMYDTPCRPTPIAELYEIIPMGKNITTLRTYISRARLFLGGSGAVQTIHGRGFGLTRMGRLAVREIIEPESIDGLTDH